MATNHLRHTRIRYCITTNLQSTRSQDKAENDIFCSKLQQKLAVATVCNKNQLLSDTNGLSDGWHSSRYHKSGLVGFQAKSLLLSPKILHIHRTFYIIGLSWYLLCNAVINWVNVTKNLPYSGFFKLLNKNCYWKYIICSLLLFHDYENL